MEFLQLEELQMSYKSVRVVIDALAPWEFSIWLYGALVQKGKKSNRVEWSGWMGGYPLNSNVTTSNVGLGG